MMPPSDTSYGFEMSAALCLKISWLYVKISEIHIQWIYMKKSESSSAKLELSHIITPITTSLLKSL